MARFWISGISLIFSLCISSTPATAKPSVELLAPSPQTGLPRQRKTYSKQNGKRVISKVESDFNGDGRMDFRQVYSENGQWVKEESADLNGDGIWDNTSYYRAPSGRKQATLYLEELDTNYDGNTDLWKEYSSQGELKVRKLDRRLTGSPDYWEHYSNGQIVRIAQDENGDGKPDSIPTPRIRRK